MENCKTNEGIQYKSIEVYENDIVVIIEEIISKNQRLVFLFSVTLSLTILLINS